MFEEQHGEIFLAEPERQAESRVAPLIGDIHVSEVAEEAADARHHSAPQRAGRRGRSKMYGLHEERPSRVVREVHIEPLVNPPLELIRATHAPHFYEQSTNESQGCNFAREIVCHGCPPSS